MPGTYVFGIDFGTDSVRACLVKTSDGSIVGNAVFEYPRWRAGMYCKPGLNQFRQHPRDYIEGLEHVVKVCMAVSGIDPVNVKAISVDTTGSTPCLVDKHGMPLSLSKEFEHEPDAMFILWKDHTAVEEAARINAAGKYLDYVGGIYSAEWYWAKWMHVLKTNQKIGDACISMAEHCDWIPFLLTGGTDITQLKRSVCAAGHKALWSEKWKGLPPREFFISLDNGFKDKIFFDNVYTSDQSCGTLSTEWAGRLGLHTGVHVGIGAFDAHMGAAGGQIEPGYMVRVMGTSTCDILITDPLPHTVHGICGQVEGSVIPGKTGLEAGQSAFGDAYNWIAKTTGVSIEQLSSDAAQLKITLNSELSLDWFNGRRTPDANQSVQSAFINVGLYTTPASLFRAVVEATCYGARAIIERLEREGVTVKGLIGIGGVAKKNPFVMQMLSDITGKELRIHASEQTCALGAAMFAAVAAGLHPDIETAMRRMGHGFEKTYTPDDGYRLLYNKRYQLYQRLGAFVQQEQDHSKPIKNIVCG